MKLKVFQKGFNYSQDGRGNRLVLHFQGCNMTCPWCSNPEGMSISGALLVDQEWLKDICCPKGAVSGQELDRSRCAVCADRPCIHAKRQKGIRISYKEYNLDDLIKECIESRPMFFDGGGVTLTGGEVTLQFEQIKALLKGLKAAGIHTAIESNGSHPSMEEYIPFVDEWIMDIKQMDDARHREWLGVSNQNTIKNIRTAAEKHSDVLLRIPLIPGFNDSRADAEEFIAFFKTCAVRPNVRVEILEYHEFGKGKWEQCGLTYFMKPGKVQPETLQYFERRLLEEGVRVVRT